LRRLAVYVLLVNESARELLLSADPPAGDPWAVVAAPAVDLPAGLALAWAAARQRGWAKYELIVQDAAGPSAIFAGLNAALSTGAGQAR
jgi:hypothetical protein